MSTNGRTFANSGFVLGLNEGMFGLLATAILLFSAAVWVAHAPNAEKTDFSLTYVGARIVHQGMGTRLYDMTLQKRLRDSLFQNPSPLFFEHPPFEALVLSPLAALPFRSAYLIWSLLNAGVWLSLIFRLRRFLPWPREDLGYLLLWLLFAPLGVALYQGQSSLLLLALFAISFAFLKRTNEFTAGLAIAFGLFKFQFVLPFALIFLFRRRWRFLYGFVTTSFFWGVLSFIAVGWRGLKGYVSFVLAIGSNPQDVSYGSAVDMPTIYGVLFAIAGHTLSHTGLNIAVAILSVLLLGFVAWQWQTREPNLCQELMFAAAVAASLMTGAHMFTHDFSPLALAMFLTAAQFSSAHFPGGKFLGIRLGMYIALLLFWIFPIYFVFVSWHCLYLMCPVLLIFVWSAIQAAKNFDWNKQNQLQYVGAR
jgi:hypothetical protein